jgi:hypothetical protein
MSTLTDNSFERVRDALANAGKRITDNRQNHFMAQCPAHDDGRPSLGVDYKGDKVMLRCYANCQNDEIVEALGLTLADLFDEAPDFTSRAGNLRDAIVVRSYTYELVNGSPWIIKDRYAPKGFMQRLPGTEPGDRSGLKGREPILYRMPQLYRAMQAGYPTIYVVDGEKDVESIERAGGLATCAPGGAGAHWKPEFSNFLKGAGEVIIVADQDTMKPDGSLGTGQQYAQDARAGMRSVGVPCKIVAPAVGKDATDHLAGGYTLDQFVPEPTAFTRPRGMIASDLMATEFEPLQWAVEGLVCSGLTICAGSPKAGKSWAWLDIALSVAAGGRAMGYVQCNQGSVLYLAREDNYRRLQSRLSLIMGGTMEAPSALEVIPAEQDWPGGEQGLAHMTEWAEEAGDPMLVVLDTLAKVEPDMGEDGKRGAYSGNYSMMSRYKQWADHHNCAVVMIHHDRKAGSGDGDKVDPFTQISGTRGLTGAADTLMFLEKVRGEPTGFLHVTGRDVAEQSIELRKAGPVWQAVTEVEVIR